MRRDDAGVGNGVAVLLMITTVLGVSAAVFMHAVYGADAAHGTIELEAVKGSKDMLQRELVVANVSDNLTYQSVTVQLDGATLKYDSTSSGVGYCVAPKGGACLDKDAWFPREHKVLPGDKIRLHGSTLAGKKIQVLLDANQAWEGVLPTS